MNEAEARAWIEDETQWQAAPALSVEEVDRLVARARVTDASGNAPDAYAPWTPSVARLVGDLRVPIARNGLVYRVTVAGTSGATEPTWPTTLGLTVLDGGVTWEAYSLAPWSWTWDLAAAVAQGFRMKEAKVAAQFDVSTAKRSQQAPALRRMRGSGIGSITLTTGLV